MPTLIVPHLREYDSAAPMAYLSAQMNSLQRHALAQQPWPAYPYKPIVFFSIAHAEHCLLLKYYVAEQHIRATHTDINAPVWEDSCVEAFFSFDDAGYYNLEFNCMGTPLAAYGKSRSGRQFLEKSSISHIKFNTAISNGTAGGYEWSLTLMIPAFIFLKHRTSSLQGVQCRANFYKCGDRLPQPHYLSWSAISAPEPNFHLPQFFGNLQFQ